MAKKSNKDNSNLPVQRLDSNSTNLIDKIVSEKDPGKLKDLVDLFNFNQNKKDILRADTYSKLLDKLSEEMYNRVNRGAVTLTNDELMAESYAEEKVYASEGEKNIYKAYLNIKNPFIVDGENTLNLANRIKEIDASADIMDTDYGVASTEKMTQWLQNNGYDGIKVKLDKDNISYYVAFNSSQIKSINNTKPTSNPDIRYSQSNNE